jgi:hypothetical protein
MLRRLSAQLSPQSTAVVVRGITPALFVLVPFTWLPGLEGSRNRAGRLPLDAEIYPDALVERPESANPA